MTVASTPSGSSWLGGTLIAAPIVIAGLLWSYPEDRVVAVGAVADGSATSASDRAGFLANLWWLPDDPMLGFVEVPVGPFLMGSDRSVDALAQDNERWSPSQPQATLDLPSFYIGKYEVTVAQFEAFTVATGRLPAAAAPGRLNHPAASVSWPDALAYCRWLEKQLLSSSSTPHSLRQILAHGWHLSLPTEAQWEKAARGTDGRVYPWGRDPQRSRANYGGEGTTRVGHFSCPDCSFGLFDMSGNVWEWTRSPYQPYPFEDRADSRDLDADALWVIRGGSFADAERNVRAAVRGAADPGVRRPFIGFRVVLTRF